MSETDWRNTTDVRIRSLESRQNAADTRDAVAEVHHTNVEKRLSAMEGTLVWLVRLIIGAMLLAVIAFVTNGGIAS